MSKIELLRAPAAEVFSQEKYQISLPEWTGPYDVLLQVIDDQELNLLDLDIAILLDHYLVYIENLPSIDIDEAGEFLVVAATLAQIKSKLLLPKEEVPAEEEKDPREDLVRYLLEYQKIKQAAQLLGGRPLLGRDVFLKGAKETFEGAESDGKGTLFQLVRGFQKALLDVRSQQPMEFIEEPVSVAERIKEVFNELQTRAELEFSDLTGISPTKTYLIATFLALLELVRLKKLKLFQGVEKTGLYFRLVEGANEEDLMGSEFDMTTESSADFVEPAPSDEPTDEKELTA